MSGLGTTTSSVVPGASPAEEESTFEWPEPDWGDYSDDE